MKWSSINTKANVTREAQEKLENLFAASERDDAFVLTWLMKEGASIVVGTGLEDDGSHSFVCFIPRLEEAELAEFYVPLDEMKARYNNVKEITAYQCGLERDGEIKLKEHELEKLQHELGFEYHDDLAERLGSFSAVYRYALSYALSDGGEVTLARADMDTVFDDCEPKDASLLEKPLYISFYGYRSPKPVRGIMPGFMEAVYFQLPEKRD